MARQTGIQEAQVVEVALSGACAELRPHLAMAGLYSVNALLKLAVVANKGLDADASPQFEALNALMEQLQQF